MDIGSASRFDIFTCTCGRRFRGIGAELAGVDFIVNKYLNPLKFLSTEYESAGHTPCPYCSAAIPLSSSRFPGVETPDYCWSCTKQLPTSRINGNVNDPKPVQQSSPTQPQQVAVAPADPFANYPQNRHEEFLVEVEFIRTVLSNPNLQQFILDKCWTEEELDVAQGLLNLPPYLVAKVKNSFMFKYHNEDEEAEDKNPEDLTDYDITEKYDEMWLKYLDEWCDTTKDRLDWFSNDAAKGCSRQAIANFIQRNANALNYQPEEIAEFRKRGWM